MNVVKRKSAANCEENNEICACVPERESNGQAMKFMYTKTFNGKISIFCSVCIFTCVEVTLVIIASLRMLMGLKQLRYTDICRKLEKNLDNDS